MRKPVLIAMTALLFLSPAAALAGGPKGCPPGLAKKNKGCLPPGQAKKIYRPGERLQGQYSAIPNPGRYGLDPGQSYYRLGDYVYRVDRNTKKVLDLVGAVAAILN
ncbi:hypothetical protein [Roseibium sp.]|uniref:hypothetical protein n=1 Tax=Roseibium sp. TaxID=1936156 RepID=UPI003D0B5738